MIRLVIILILIIGSKTIFAQNALPKSRQAIRKELKLIITNSNETGWSKHIKCIQYKDIPIEYEKQYLSFDPETVLVFALKQRKDNDEIFVVFDHKSFCLLEVILLTISDLDVIIKNRFPFCTNPSESL